MGTRSLTILLEEDGTEIVIMYKQFDGNPTAHGQELADFLKDHKVVNGFQPGDTLKNTFNGAGCMAAAVVAHFKDDIGNVYLYPSGARDAGEEYTYTVRPEGKKIRLICEAGKTTIFNGYPEEFNGEKIEAKANEE